LLAQSGCREKRHRLLPARAVVYFVLGLLTLPTSSALTRARQRLGSKPLELLFDLRRGPLAGQETPGAFASGTRAIVDAAFDGVLFSWLAYPYRRNS
jgi:hypothetical protein